VHTVVGGIAIVLASALLSVAGLWLRRKYIPITEENEAVAGYFAVIGVVYGVISAFVIFLVWADFEDARQNVTREANQIVDLYLMTRSLPAPFPQTLKERLTDYTKKVSEIEWNLLAEGKTDPRVDQAYRALWRAFEQVEMSNPRHLEIYARALGQLSDLSDSRRQRLHASKATIPPMIWVILLCGALITVFYSYFFVVQSFAKQAWLTAGLTASVALMLFLILALDRPFTGDIRINADPFRVGLTRMQE
jgi:Protein of unknown function (DUF4239)